MNRECQRKPGQDRSPEVVIAGTIGDRRVVQGERGGREIAAGGSGSRSRLGVGTAVTDRVIGIALERDLREFPHHPHIEGVVQEQVCQ